MSRSSQLLGREFIAGTNSFNFTLEAWVHIVDFCKGKNMTVLGPFKSSRKEMALRTHLDYVCDVIHYSEEWLQFDTTEKLRILRQFCGEMVGYAVNRRSKCPVGETKVLQDHEHVYMIIPDKFSELEASPGFYRRNVKSYGINFKFCTVSEKLTIYICYSMVAVFDEEEIQAIVKERNQTENKPRNPSDYASILGNNNATVTTQIEYDYRDIIKTNAMVCDDQNNLLTVKDDYNDGDLAVPCMIVEAEDTNLVGQTVMFSIEDASHQIMKYLRSIFTN